MKIINKIVIFHVGARDSYNISKYFHRKRILVKLFTDFWITPFYIAVLPTIFKKKVQRRYSELLKNNVKAFSLLRLLFCLLKERKIKDDFKRWYFHDRFFSHFVKKRLDNDLDMIWGYSNCSLEAFKSVGRNVVKVLNQIDPGVAYYEIRKELSQKHPDYEEEQIELPEFFRSRMLAEWNLADVIVVNSNYSKSCLVSKGVDDSKILVIPLIYDQTTVYTKRTFNKRLRVGFVGNINLIKGFIVYQEVARKLANKMDFLAIGNIMLNKETITESSNYINFMGLVSRDDLSEIYKSLDVLLFPSFSDGFGMVQLEAMGFGIPVIASKNCGDVVIDGYNGFRTNKPEEIVILLNELNADRDKLSSLSENAAKTVGDYSQDKFATIMNENFKQVGIIFKDAE